MSIVTLHAEYANRATPELRRIAQQLANPVALYKDVGRHAANLLKKHYLELNQSKPNKLGGKRTWFWNEVRESVQQPALVPGGVDIVIAHPHIAAKVFGARITAKNAKALTIPIHALAYGRRAKVFENETGHRLFLGKSKNGNAILFADLGHDIVPIYLLTKAVNVPADPEALPPRDEFTAAIIAKGQAHLARMLARGAGT